MQIKFTHDVWVEIGVFVVGAGDGFIAIASCFGRDGLGGVVCIIGCEWGTTATFSLKALVTAKPDKNNSIKELLLTDSDEINHLMHNGQTHFKNFVAFAARFLKCVWPFWEIMH